MSRRKGSKNARPSFYSIQSMQKKALALSEKIDKYITIAYNNYTFNKLTDFNELHKVKDDLKELATMQIDFLSS